MQVTFDFGVAAVYGGLIGGAVWILFKFLVSKQTQQNLRANPAKAWRMYWLFFAPILVGTLLLKQYAEPHLYTWLTTPIVATLPDGTIATGKWWIDKKGIGHTELTTAALDCTETYDAKTSATFVHSTANCKDALGAQVLIERFGGKFKDRGEGVWKRGDQYGWYVFGWKARLAILTDGWLGVPGHKAAAQDFKRLEVLAKSSKSA